MHAFFNRPVEDVARELTGKILRIDGKVAVIRKVLARTAEDNRRWIRSKPLFGKDPVEAYVSSFRGSHLLFLRTGPRNTCIRIEAVELAGRKISRPGRVCKELGINSERSGDVLFDGTVVTVKWHQ